MLETGMFKDFELMIETKCMYLNVFVLQFDPCQRKVWCRKEMRQNFKGLNLDNLFLFIVRHAFQ